jgi:threonine synthase
MSHWNGLIHRYRSRLKISQIAEPITLCEGNTPLIPASRLAEWVCPGAELFLKYEGLNPTGSFKDRGMTTAMTEAVAEGARAVICASTGNTAASAAAYAARAGVTCAVLIPDGKIALGKLAGAVAYGAKVIAIQGSFDDALRMVREIGERAPIAVVNSVNPARLEGQKTAAWEVCDQLGHAPDWLCLPVGNAGNISAYWMGFNECSPNGCVGCAGGGCQHKPQLLGAQAAGAAPLVLGHVVEQPETKATAIRIGNPARGQQALNAIRESNGVLLSVTDDEIFEAYRQAARLDGVFCEPSSATGIAGLRKAVVEGRLRPEGKRIVCVLTGNGLKDPDSVFETPPAIEKIEATTDALLKVIA